MKLESLECKLHWPLDLPIQELRQLVLEKLGCYGNPLRWSIAHVEVGAISNESRYIYLEAVVITR